MYEHSELTRKILQAAFAVHGTLGCGFLEKVYQEALAIELSAMDISFEREKHIRISYRGQQLNTDYIADFIVEGKVIVELKALAALETVHEAQTINYLKATGLKVALLINFGERSLRYRRLVM